MSKVKKNELGKGLAALLGNIEQAVNESPEKAAEVIKELAGSVAMLDLSMIEVNTEQPRKDFDEALLTELSESIRIHGIIQPITVRRMAPNQYQLISGERRFRASKMAGLTEVPAYIRIANDQEMHEMALIENIQRADLNPIEIATTYARLMSEFNLSQDKLAERLAKGRPTIANAVRLLKLPDDIQVAIKKREISAGHAKVLVGIEDFAFRTLLFKRIIKDHLSVREVEEIARDYAESKNKKKSPPPSVNNEWRNVQDTLSAFFGARVALRRDADGKGQITVKFGSDDELNRILDLVEDKK